MWLLLAVLVTIALAAPRYGADSRWLAPGEPPPPRSGPTVRGDLALLFRQVRRPGLDDSIAQDPRYELRLHLPARARSETNSGSADRPAAQSRPRRPTTPQRSTTPAERLRRWIQAEPAPAPPLA